MLKFLENLINSAKSFHKSIIKLSLLLLMAASNSNLVIRNEKKSEWRTVEEVTREAFWNYFQPGADEHFILHKLREHADFIKELDFVAELDGKIVGSIVYSKAYIEKLDGSKYDVICFGPVCVLPSYRKLGVGRKLIEHSANVAADLGHKAIIIYGDPRYYGRLGFRCGEKYDITSKEGKFSVSLMTKVLVPGALDDAAGKFFESSAFNIDPSELEAFDSSFPPGIKEETESQREFNVLITLSYVGDK